MLARLTVLGLAALAPCLGLSAAQIETAPAAYDVRPVDERPRMRVLTWDVSGVVCDAGTRVAPATLNPPLPQTQFLTAANAPQPVRLNFDLDSEGRPFNIRSEIDKRARQQTRDLMPSLRASRFTVDGARQSCSITYTPQSAPFAEAPLETLAALGVATRLRMSKDAWERISPGDCRDAPRLAPLTRTYPDFRKLTRREGARQWTYVTYDIDGEGVPVNLATALTSGYDALDAEARAAVQAGRYAGGPRTGCAQAWWTGPATIPAPPIPPKSETGGNPACKLEDRWDKEPRLTFPPEYRQRAIEGWAILRFDVAPWGEIGGIEVIDAQPSSEFGEAAMNVLRSARFKPQESGLSGCIDRVIFRMRKDEADTADGAADARTE
jgi:TonB family protein